MQDEIIQNVVKKIVQSHLGDFESFVTEILNAD